MQTSAEKIWAGAQAQLRSMLAADTYTLWFAPLRVCSHDDSCIMLEVANDFCEMWLKDNYMGLLQDVIAATSGRQLKVQFKVAPGQVPGATAPAAPTPKTKTTQKAAERTASSPELSFNPKYTFDTFVVGNNNNFAYSAALAVAQHPG